MADNGQGVREEATPDAGGAGQGLALHSTMLALFGGSLTLEHALAGHTRLVLALPEQALRAAESTPPNVEEEVTHAEAR